PVCGQEHDIQRTRARLERLLDEAPFEAELASPDTDALAATLAQHEVELAAASAGLARSTLQAQARIAREADIDTFLTTLGVRSSESDPAAVLRDLLEGLEKRIPRLVLQQQRGETLALTIAQSGQSARRAELMSELAS